MMNNLNLDRRKFLMGLSIFMGTSLTPIAARAIESAFESKKSTKPLLLTLSELNTAKVMADLILPDTDTPGASAAGVHHFINFTISEFLPQKEKELMISGINSHTQILILPIKEQEDYMRKLDVNRKEDMFYLSFKQLVIYAYYTSEIGASIELNYDPVPGPYKEIPFSSVGKIWS